MTAAPTQPIRFIISSRHIVPPDLTVPHLAAQSKWVGALLSGSQHLDVPGYQRPFCWTEKEAGRLLLSLAGAFEAKSAITDTDLTVGHAGYFIGTMLLVRHARDGATDPAGHYDIVDGQQRLVTLTILFSVLRDLIAQDDMAAAQMLQAMIEYGAVPANEPARRRLRLRGLDDAFFARYVQCNGASLDMPDAEPDTIAQANLLAVREHFITELIEHAPEWRRAFAAFVAESCAVVVVTTNAIDHAHQIFTVLNDAGKPLARNDILKAELIGGVPEATRDATLAQWDALELRLGGAFESLFSHVRTMHGRTSGQVIEAIRRIAHESGGAGPFLWSDLLPSGAAFAEILEARHSGAPQSASINALLGYLGWLPGAEWVAPALLFWRGGEVNPSGRAEPAPAALLAFLTSLDRLAYGLRVLGLGGDKRAARFNAVASALRLGEDVMRPGGPLAFTREEERNIGYNLRTLHARNPQTCKLVLLRINDRMTGRAQCLDPDAVTVEHVLPQRIGPSSPWRQDFADADVRERCTTSLGNLILLGKAANERARNLDFETKRPIYLAGADLARNALLDEVRACTSWNPNIVDDIERRRLEHIVGLWGFVSEPGDARRGKPRALLTRHA